MRGLLTGLAVVTLLGALLPSASIACGGGSTPPPVLSIRIPPL